MPHANKTTLTGPRAVATSAPGYLAPLVAVRKGHKYYSSKPLHGRWVKWRCSVLLPRLTTSTKVRCDMSDRSGSSPFQAIFESALRDYEKQTGITLAHHPLAEQLQNCQSVESVTTLLQGQARAFSKFKGSDKIMKSLKSVVSVIAALGQDINMVCPWLLIGILHL